MVGRVAPATLELHEVHRFPNEPVRLPDGLHWDILRLYREVLGGLREAARARRRWPASGSTRGAWTIGLLDEAGSLLGDPYHYRDARIVGRGRRGPRDHPAGRAVCPDRAPVPAVQHDLPACRGARDPGLDAAGSMLLIPDLIGFWLSGHARQRAHQRLDDGAARRAPADVGRRAHRCHRAAGPDLPLARRTRRRRRAAARCVRAETGVSRRDGADPRRVARHGVGRRRRAGRRGRLRVHRLRHVGPGRGRARRAGPERGEPAGELHQRGRRRRPDPLPAQRHGAVAAPGIAPGLGARGQPRGPAVAPRRGRRASGRRTVIDPDDPSFLPPDDMPSRIAAACRRLDQPIPADRGRRSSGASSTAWPAPSAGPSTMRPACRAGPSTSSTWSGAGRATSCSAS